MRFKILYLGIIRKGGVGLVLETKCHKQNWLFKMNPPMRANIRLQWMVFLLVIKTILREVESWRKVYATVKFIPDGLYQTEFAVSVLPTTIPSDCMDIDEVAVPVPQDMYEPARCLKDGAPPKRFYRTFWRSVMRRILASSSRK